MEVEEVQSLANAWPIAVGILFLGRQRLLPPVLKARTRVFLRETAPVPPAACKGPYCTAHRQASAGVCHQEPHSRVLLNKPSTGCAAEAPTTDAQAGSKISNHCCHTPCCHTPRPAFLGCDSKTSNHYLVSAITPTIFHHTPNCLTLLEPQSRFGGKQLNFQVVCPQTGLRF